MKYIILIVFSIFVLQYCIAGSSQSWIQANIDKLLFDKIHVGFNEENRIGIKDGQHIDEIHTVHYIMYDFNEYIGTGINYRHVLNRDNTDVRYTHDYRPGIDFVLKNELYNWKLSNRSRVICRKIEGEQEYFRYRNLSKIMSPWKWTDLAINPYCSYEWYFDDGSKDRRYRKNDKFSIQWLTFGANFKLTRNIKPSLWYRLIETKDRIDHNWNVGHVIGLSLNFNF